MELVRILISHPVAEVSIATSESYKGKKFSQVFPGFKGLCDLELEDFDASKIVDECDIAFVCLPHGASMEKTKKLYDKGIRVIDLSGDFRFQDVNVYEKWYGIKHSLSDLGREAVLDFLRFSERVYPKPDWWQILVAMLLLLFFPFIL